MSNYSLPEDSQERKATPLYRGLLRYFPAALAAVARCSREGNEKHSPGREELQHVRTSSEDEEDAMLRHLTDRMEALEAGDSYRVLRESAAVAWRALAMLQKDLEELVGAPTAPAASYAPKAPAASSDDVPF